MAQSSLSYGMMRLRQDTAADADVDADGERDFKLSCCVVSSNGFNEINRLKKSLKLKTICEIIQAPLQDASTVAREHS
ncbi:hypothetical protein EMPG_13527 [Blastomyces silverae]|uniref:Uncharacterized protein n=1 Tax=Blastomyces silverae TaxID=2060906 RepID=A0A0H1BJG4_9EURO|nr:hypothetical protein EMPG_13527 [Blastomyces silverae]